MSNFFMLIKEKRKWVFFSLLCILLLIAAFGVGYLVAKQANPAPIIIEKHTS